MATESEPSIESGMHSTWATVEMIGHRVHHGMVTEAELFGRKMAKVDALQPGGGFQTHYYHPDRIYAITPRTEEAIRAEFRRYYGDGTPQLAEGSNEDWDDAQDGGL